MGTTEPIHIQPTAELAERVLLPGDPGRALALAQLLLEKPLMFNHNRGLWGYTGRAADGELLSIQSTGMGGPSAAIVLHELAGLGAKRAIRVGTCGALNGELGLGELVIAGEAIAADGTSRALGAGERVTGDVVLTQALALAPSETLRRHADATIVSTDLFYEPRREIELRWREQGAVAVEMEAATLFAAGARAGVAVACALVVSDVITDRGAQPAASGGPPSRGARRERIAAELLGQAAEAMGRLAAAALGA